ncbi:MAG: hypothetical protein KF824_08720 [Fimbriimonadaceae bacterium]|nr:MAG: hypothetical protein KF824_08720 [Fimbriimonadaceae bacterium]
MKRENILLLIASLIISVALWVQVQPMFEPGREREFSIPLSLENKPENLAIFSAPDAVTIVASGTLADLDKLDTATVEAFVNLERIKAGQANFAVQVRAPANSGLTFRPKVQTLQITAENVSRAMKTLSVVPTGAPPDGLAYGNAVCQPAEVNISGPESYFKQVASVQVTLDLTRARPGVSVSVPVEILDKEGNPVPSMIADPPKVTVAASFSVSMASRPVPVIVDWSGSPAPGFEITEILVNPQKVEISGETETISGVTVIVTEPISLEGIRANKDIKAKLVVPSKSSVEPMTVMVTIRVKKR